MNLRKQDFEFLNIFSKACNENQKEFFTSLMNNDLEIEKAISEVNWTFAQFKEELDDNNFYKSFENVIAFGKDLMDDQDFKKIKLNSRDIEAIISFTKRNKQRSLMQNN